ncbi:MAG TPA: carboxypeptidase-like regulatory domain-containing protein [Thermoanaerobaculia bacterium]|nr:carboxypeptidase-like regulatory domain-containing protein [Thermoanaerobaculia bacterium]
MRLRLVALLVLGLPVLALPAFANITSSSLTGTVTIGGKPAAGVTVTAGSRTTVTNAHGRYWLAELPPGVYDVTFSLPAHTTLTKRAVLELARVARTDATLEPNPDEDSTTSTAVTVSVAETIFPTTHFDDRALDRLPTGRLGSAFLAPDSRFGNIIVDGVPDGAVPSEEMVEQVTAVNGVSPVEWETHLGSPIAFRTRSGGEDFFFTLRDTITNDDDLQHFGEATAGGRIVPERLWFFAGAWKGEDAPGAPDREGVLAKIDGQFGTAHRLGLSYSDALQVFSTAPFDYDTVSLRYTGVAGPRFTADAVAARTENTDFFSGRASVLLGDHVLTAGATDAGAAFASDRWSYARWNVYAGLRHDDGELDPRVAVSYDLHGNGARAIVATWGEYAQPGVEGQTFRVASLGFASALGNGGSARVDFLRRESGSFWQHDLQLDARYRLFDRFEAGGTYTLTNRVESPSFLFPDQSANVWLSAEVPLGNHEFGVTVLQHYLEASRFSEAPTDLALRYSIPFTRVGLLLAFDMTNVFDNPDGISLFPPRAYRFWLRVRI